VIDDKYGYSGEWRDNKKEGNGSYIYSNGERYEGGWQRDKKHGFGTYKYRNGDSYSG
jgi:hypothetical protein